MSKKFIQVFLGLTLLTLVRGRKELVLSTDPSYIVGWEVIGDKISFHIKAATLGYVGFGINRAPNMSGADLVISGVYPNGTAYYGDFHAIGNRPLIQDKVHNWVAGEISEDPATGVTLVSFDRLLDTGDADGDVQIQDELIWVLWATGFSDELVHHGKNRGAQQVNLLAP